MSLRVTAVALALGLVLAFSPCAFGSTKKVGVAPIRAVIIADESGSLDQQAVANERNAAALLALSDLSPRSQFAVDGFGSSNGPGQTAVVTYCGFITVSGHTARERLADCAQKIHARTLKEGNDTDHAAALRAAVSQLKHTPPTQTPVIFLMTDGVLDVSHSPQYGKRASQRDAEARRPSGRRSFPRPAEPASRSGRSDSARK